MDNSDMFVLLTVPRLLDFTSTLIGNIKMKSWVLRTMREEELEDIGFPVHVIFCIW